MKYSAGNTKLLGKDMKREAEARLACNSSLALKWTAITRVMCELVIKISLFKGTLIAVFEYIPI